MARGAGDPGWFSGLASKLVKKNCQVAQERCTIPSQSHMEASASTGSHQRSGPPQHPAVALPWSYQITESAQSSVLVTPDFLMEFLLQFLYCYRSSWYCRAVCASIAFPFFLRTCLCLLFSLGQCSASSSASIPLPPTDLVVVGAGSVPKTGSGLIGLVSQTPVMSTRWVNTSATFCKVLSFPGTGVGAKASLAIRPSCSAVVLCTEPSCYVDCSSQSLG